ncbi:LamG-like jellyroll fold domain-containing protein [Simplicispira psychrophila]|uniref:LamG-like jellyroll fold domain-containing protein n=1 Tax=Simplicispira psychrophila TaxID=80882 RepID=UPI00048090D6|nr:LamG-like jellyroll fold domain-containing protein [Simplicispira psychrophila]
MTNPLNNAPINIFGGAFNATTEDGSAVQMTVADFLSQKAQASDQDGDTLGIAVTATNPGWEYWNGSVWYGFDKFATPLSDTNACLLAPDTLIRYNPTRDFNGTASFTYKVWDQTADSYSPALLQGAGNTTVGTAYSIDSKQATIEVTPVNDAPYLGSTRLIGHFDGADDFVDLPDMTFGGDMTIEAWIYVTQHGTWSRIVELTQAGERTNNVVFGFDGASGQLVYQNNIDGTMVGQITGAYIQPNQWTHVAITHSSAGPATLYVNGAVSASGNFAAVANVLRDDNLIGESHWRGDANFSGDMHDVRIWTTVRTQTEIVAGMNQSLTTADGLLANYVLDTNFQDYSGHSFDGTTQGTLNGPAVIQLAVSY